MKYIDKRVTPALIKEALLDVRQLLAKPENWTKEVFARDASGVPVPRDSGNACQFCLMGAIDHAVGIGDMDMADELRRKIRSAIYTTGSNQSIAAFNDDYETTHTDVLGVLDKALDLAEQSLRVAEYAAKKPV